MTRKDQWQVFEDAHPEIFFDAAHRARLRFFAVYIDPAMEFVLLALALPFQPSMREALGRDVLASIRRQPGTSLPRTREWVAARRDHLDDLGYGILFPPAVNGALAVIFGGFLLSMMAAVFAPLLLAIAAVGAYERWRPRVLRPPGYRAGAALRLLVGRRFYEDHFEQHIVDHREEWMEVHEANHPRIAVWIQIRCCIILGIALLWLLPLELLRKLLSVSSRPGS